MGVGPIDRVNSSRSGWYIVANLKREKTKFLNSREPAREEGQYLMKTASEPLRPPRT